MKKINKQKKWKIKFPVKDVLTAKLPAAISSRITPLFAVGLGSLTASIVMLFIPNLRPTFPMFFCLAVVVLVYAYWQKSSVLKNGYDEYVFKVMDYTYIAPLPERIKHPTGMLLINKAEENEEEQNIYHVAVSGKNSSLPPVDWLIRVYVPKGSVASEFGDRKYFPTVYGYKIEGEDKE